MRGTRKVRGQGPEGRGLNVKIASAPGTALNWATSEERETQNGEYQMEASGTGKSKERGGSAQVAELLPSKKIQRSFLGGDIPR